MAFDRLGNRLGLFLDFRSILRHFSCTSERLGRIRIDVPSESNAWLGLAIVVAICRRGRFHDFSDLIEDLFHLEYWFPSHVDGNANNEKERK